MTFTTFRLIDRPYELVLFDLRAPGTVERLLTECSAWGECASVELLGSHHAVLIVRAGGATRMGDRGAA
jgi:hypothetical protein